MYFDALRLAGEIVTDFDEGLCQAAVESVMVYPDKSLTFMFRDGTEIPTPQKTK